MKIIEAYPMSASKDRIFFRFKSVGTKGTIDKGIVFQFQDDNIYNLAFGDIVDDNLEDKIISNKGDFVKVISTVANAIYYFFKQYPNAVVEINPIDKKRARFYNSIFKRRYLEIKDTFILIGIKNDKKEPYNPSNSYENFELSLKK